MCVTLLTAFWILDFMQENTTQIGDFPYNVMDIKFICFMFMIRINYKKEGTKMFY